MPYVYILKCRDGSYYTGSTRDLERRILQHQAGEGAACTRRRLPVELIYATEFEHIHEAYALEKRVQGWSRAKREALIEGRYADLPNLAKRTSRSVTSLPVE